MGGLCKTNFQYSVRVQYQLTSVGEKRAGGNSTLKLFFLSPPPLIINRGDWIRVCRAVPGC